MNRVYATGFFNYSNDKNNEEWAKETVNISEWQE